MARYLTGRETRTAALKTLKLAFKADFPNTTFKVSTKDCLNISWIGGPTEDQVEAAMEGFANEGFDGSVDYAYSKDAWMTPKGTLVPRSSGGSAITNGYDEAYSYEAPEEGCEAVTPSTSYVFTRRLMTKEEADNVVETLCEQGAPRDVFSIIESGKGFEVSTVWAHPENLLWRHRLADHAKAA